MSITKRRPVIAIHRDKREIAWKGEEAVLESFALRDLQALAQALVRNPGCWKTELGLLDRKGNIKERGTLAHFALKTGWIEVLPVLFLYGDPLNHADLDSKYTPLGTAIRIENEQAFNWLIQQSLGEEPGAINPLEVLVTHANELCSPLATAQKLLNAGYNPWHTADDGREMPQISLQKKNIQLASFLAKHGHAQGCLFTDELIAQWLPMLHKGELSEHKDFLAALRHQGREPSLSLLACHYREMMVRDDLAGKHYGQIVTLEHLIVQRAAMGVDKEDAKYSAKTLRSVSEHIPSYWGQTLARLEHMTLDENTSINSAHTIRPRI